MSPATAADALQRAAHTGVLVGVLDAALLWPLVTVAARREAGATLRAAVASGRLWSGARTALTMLTPYCVAVEGATAAARSASGARTAAHHALVAPLVSLAVAAGLQPVEKKLVMEQLLQTGAAGKTHLSLRDMAAYAARPGGLRGLWAGFPALWARETVYIAAVTVLNPLAAERVPQPALAAFAVGFGSGFASAPLQTLNVVMKDERNRGVRRAWAPLLAGDAATVLNRLFYGAAARSTRTGAAGVLWYAARRLTADEHRSR